MDQDVKDRIVQAIQSYYSGNPIMDDEEYEELIAPYSQHDIEMLKQKSIRVMDKVKHKFPMTSLPKVLDKDKLPEHTDSTIYQLKYDGCSIEVHYDSSGAMDYACTRGDYTYGDNRTVLATFLASIGSIPQQFTSECSLRGELVISDADWPSISKYYKNQRNAAAGIANRDDIQLAKFLTFVPYDIVHDDGRKELCKEDILNCAPYWTEWTDAEEAFREADVPVDGLVIKQYSDSNLAEQTNAVAYKFSDQTFDTVLKGVLWQQGRTGKLTPVVEFETVFIDAEVSRASLGSYARFKELDLHYGDTIEVKKANMVIPYVVCNKGGGNKEQISAPKYYNGHETYVDGMHLFANRDDNWRDRLYAQVDQLAAKGIGRSFVDRVITEYGVMSITELVEVVNQDGFHIPRAQQRTVDKARRCLAEVANCSLIQFLSSLCIDGIGWQTWSKVLDKVEDVASNDNMSQCDVLLSLDSPYEFVDQIAGFGPSNSQAFADAYPLVREQLDDYYRMYGHYPKDWTREKGADGPKVVVTGRFDGMPRSEVEARLRANGYDVQGKVTSDTFALLAGIGGGSKRNAARQLGIPTIEAGGDLQKGFDELMERSKHVVASA